MASIDLHEANETTIATANGNHIDHGWQKVSYPKRQRKIKPNADPQKPNISRPNGTLTNGGPNVFYSLEQQSEDSRHRILEAQTAYTAVVDANLKAKHNKSEFDDDDDDDSSDMEGVKPNGKPTVEKKVKQKKPKVTVAEAAAKIDSTDLSVYLAELNGEQSKIQMQKFANYYGKAFQEVVAGQFPWMKMFRESTIIKLADVGN